MKIKFFTVIFFTSILYSEVKGQGPVLEWAHNLGGAGQDYGQSIFLKGGGVYTAGCFEGTVDFNPGSGTYNLTSGGSADIFISKMDSNGNFGWAKKIGGGYSDCALSITLDNYGNIYTTGSFQGTVDFDPGAGNYFLTSASLGYPDIFISKLDSNGNFLWAKILGGFDTDQGTSITTDNNGNVYTTGGFQNSVDFDPGTGTYFLSAASAGYNDIFILKLDSGGNFLWAKKVGSTNNDYGASIIIDNNGNSYITGGFQNAVDFDPNFGIYTLTSVGLRDVFILKMDSVGNFLWAKNIGGPDYDSGKKIKVDSKKNVFVIGEYRNTVDFDPDSGTFNLISDGGSDIFISKLDSNGGFVFAKSFGGINSDYGNSNFVDDFGSIYSTGVFNGTVDFDPGSSTYYLQSNGSSDFFISKLDSSGNFVWAKVVGGTGDEYGLSISVSSNGKVYVTGSFQSVVNFNSPASSNLNSNGLDDAYVAKYNQCSSSSATLNIETCSSYHSPSGNYIWTSSGTYLDTIFNSGGCDSLLTIFLNFPHSYSTLNPITCENYVSPSGNYVWSTSGIYYDTIPNAAGCDSLLTINLSILSTNSTLIQTVCESYLSPSANYTWTTTGIYFDTIPNSNGCDSLLTINLSVLNSFAQINPSTCESFISPSGIHTWSTSGIYSDTIPNAAGCDSIITINLTVNSIDTSVTQTDSVLSATASGAIYQWLNCDNSFAIINGATNQTFTATANGNYAVAITQNGCTDTSACYAVTGVGISEFAVGSMQLAVFPNPASTQLTVRSMQLAISSIQITDLTGRELLNENLSGVIASVITKQSQTLLSLDIHSLSSGIYFIKVQLSDGSVGVRKFVKE